MVDVARQLHLLGRYVRQSTHDLLLTVIGRMPLREHRSQVKVQNLDEWLSPERLDCEKVRGVKVTMHDAERMRLCHRVAGLNDEVDRLLDREGTMLREPALEVPTFKERRYDVKCAVLCAAHVERANDVFALDVRQQERLARETIETVVANGLRRQDLNRYGLIEEQVAGFEDGQRAALH